MSFSDDCGTVCAKCSGCHHVCVCSKNRNSIKRSMMDLAFEDLKYNRPSTPYREAKSRSKHGTNDVSPRKLQRRKSGLHEEYV